MKGLIIGLFGLFTISCNGASSDAKTNAIDNDTVASNANEQANENEAVAYFASGCFWCVEEVFESIIGVREVVSGYAGGNTQNPTYKEICTGSTGHAETVQIFYDPAVVSFDILVDAFFASHDPTTLDRQGPDSGSQYRSIAFYLTDSEKKVIEEKIARLNASGKWKNPIVTEVKQIDKFWPAESYHQNYSRLNVGNPYVRNVSIPRYHRFVEEFDPKLLKH